MKLSNELLKNAKECKSAEEIKTLAKDAGIELSAAEAEEAFSRLNKNGELADDELSNAAGGGSWCYSSGDTPKYKLGDYVTWRGELYEVVFVHNEKTSDWGLCPEFTYDLRTTHGTDIMYEIEEGQIS